MKRRDRSGERYGRLVVSDQWEARRECNRSIVYWLCHCDCDGKEVWVRTDFLRANGTGTTSCGCRHDEATAENREAWRLRRPGSTKFPGLKSRTPDYQKAANTAYYQENKERMNAQSRQYRQDNIGEVKAGIAAWRAGPAVPPWADHEALVAFYRDCPPSMDVDHKIPLKGKYVSGLHVVENLQYLTRDANRRKKNRVSD